MPLIRASCRSAERFSITSWSSWSRRGDRWPDQAGDLVVALGVERREGEVLELPLDGVHAEAVRQGRVDLQGLARLALLLVAWHVAQRPHVVQPVGELDDQDPDVAGHRHDHLADGFRLGGGAVLDLVQLGDAVDEGRDVLAELAAQLVERVGGVLDGVVQQRGTDRLGVHAELGEDGRHRERVGDVRVTRLALLVLMPVRRHRVGPLHRPHVRLGVVRADGLDQRFEYRVHVRPPLCSEPRQATADPGAGRSGLRRGREPLTSRASRARGARGPRVRCTRPSIGHVGGVSGGRRIRRPPQVGGRARLRPGRRYLVRLAAVVPAPLGSLRRFPDPGSPFGAGRGGRQYITGHKRSSYLPGH